MSNNAENKGGSIHGDNNASNKGGSIFGDNNSSNEGGDIGKRKHDDDETVGGMAETELPTQGQSTQPISVKRFLPMGLRWLSRSRTTSAPAIQLSPSTTR